MAVKTMILWQNYWQQRSGVGQLDCMLQNEKWHRKTALFRVCTGFSETVLVGDCIEKRISG